MPTKSVRIAEDVFDLFVENVGRAIQDLEIPGIANGSATALDKLEDGLLDDPRTAEHLACDLVDRSHYLRAQGDGSLDLHTTNILPPRVLVNP
ncbi:MAG: hypothetical protein V3T72_09860 [Thermoanaerobaculia bacterium]